MELLLWNFISLIAGGIVIFFYLKYGEKSQILSSLDEAKRIVEEARREISDRKSANELENEKQKLALIAQNDKNYKRKEEQLKKDFQKMEGRILKKENKLDLRMDTLDAKENELQNRKEDLEKRNAELDRMIQVELQKLEEISGLSRDEASKQLLTALEDELKQELALKVKEYSDEFSKESQKKAISIILDSIQKCKIEQIVDPLVSVVNLPSDEMKGRIIGREGRNIRALENLTGINVIIDDTPEAVVLSGFNSVQRELARRTLEFLIEDGRIHPARIEEVYMKTKKELEEEMSEIGNNTLLDMGITNVHPEIVRHLGKLKFRTSYGQNVLAHSVEVAKLAGSMAGEIGLNADLAKRAGILHDIGKSIESDGDRSHTKLGKEFLRKHGEVEKVYNVCMSHHEEEPCITPEEVLVGLADSISAARPGARSETLEVYVKRLNDLETIAKSFDGVSEVYAVRAGRELRVVVQPEFVDDARAAAVSRDIAAKIQSELEYPGMIKVIVVREVRQVEYAK